MTIDAEEASYDPLQLAWRVPVEHVRSRLAQVDAEKRRALDELDRKVAEMIGGTATDLSNMGAQQAQQNLTRHYLGSGTPLPNINQINARAYVPTATYDSLVNQKEPALSSDNYTTYYEVTVIDSRVENDEAAHEFFPVRADDAESAKLKAVLRGNYDESDLAHLDFVVRALNAVKKYVPDDDE